ncbi:glycosyltransferase [Ramlibacter rhizophilus]|uniref:Glycosyltransferase n=1 Tax=Ramlibacter rhizophilus TaxID=1781167 RepID=A0A4Z0C068_9BURK|nr:glycosyltransferase [Ramlibacter rhizophilus]TFZ04204.1 glycosyltransferase [Ramlibacter rhizophilus]
MRKVLVFRSDLLPVTETFIYQQFLALRRWQPALFGYRLVEPGINLQGINPALIRGPMGTDPSRWGGLPFRALNFIGISSGIRAVHRFAPDLAHVHFGVDAVSAWGWLSQTKIPVVVTLHGYDVTIRPEWWWAGNGGRSRRHYPNLLARLARQPRVRFVAVSNSIRSKAIAMYGLPSEKVSVLHIGVDREVFKPVGLPVRSRGAKVLFVGRLVEKKGALNLIRAMAVVQHALPSAHLTVVGDGPQRAECEQLAKVLAVNVCFKGACSHEEVRAIMQDARVFCLPSITAENGDAEGLPISLLEAQACGLPVVATQAGREAVLDGESGFICPSNDIAAIAGKLKHILTVDDCAEAMSASAIIHVARSFDLANCTSELERLYDCAAS